MRLATIAWRGLAARPLRTALAIIGVGLGVAVVMATTIAASASEGALRSATADLLGRAEVRLRAFDEAGFTPRAVQAIRALPDIRAVAPVAERRLTVSTDPGPDERVYSLLVFGIDPRADAAIREPRLTEGRALSADSMTDALVARSWAAANGLGVGDRLRLDGRRDGLPPLTIVGLLADTGMAALERGEVLIISRTALDGSFQVPAPIRYLDLDLGDADREVAVGRAAAAIDEPYIVESAQDAAARLAAAQASFTGVALLFGLVALLVGTFLVGNTLAMTVAERTREIGLLRAAGTTSRQVLGLVLRQALAIGLAGSLLGIVMGIGLAAGMIAFLSSTRAVLASGLPLPALGVLLAFTVGIAVTLVAAILPARRAAGLSPLDALRPSRRPVAGLTDRLAWLLGMLVVLLAVGMVLLPADRTATPVIAVGLGALLLLVGATAAALLVEPLGRLVGRPFEWAFGAQGMLGRANLSRDRSRSGLTVGAMVIALAAVVALGTVADSARAGTERWVASILPGGHAIRTTVPLDVETFRPTFEATTGLRATSPVLEVPVIRITRDSRVETALAGIDPNVFSDGGALIIRGATRDEAFSALRAGGAVLVPAVTAAREGLEVGDSLPLGRPDGERHDFAVAGLLEYTLPAVTPDGALLISSADARDLFGVTTASLWVMVPQPTVAASAFESAVNETAMGLAGRAVTARDLAGDVATSLDRLIGLFDALALIAVVIGALGIVNTLGVGITERVREIAVLRSHGMTVGQVQAMVVAEAAMMGAMAGVLAVVVGLGVALALAGAGANELAAGIRPPWSLLAGVVLLGTGVAALAGLYPARVAASLPIVQHLKHFE